MRCYWTGCSCKPLEYYVADIDRGSDTLLERLSYYWYLFRLTEDTATATHKLSPKITQLNIPQSTTASQCFPSHPTCWMSKCTAHRSPLTTCTKRPYPLLWYALWEETEYVDGNTSLQKLPDGKDTGIVLPPHTGHSSLVNRNTSTPKYDTTCGRVAAT